MRKINSIAKKTSFYFKSFVLLAGMLIAANLANGQTQVTVTGTTPVTSVNYSTLGAAFTAINGGAHKGVIVVTINSSTTETGPCILNSNGASVNTVYSSVNIQPIADGLTISGPTTTGRGLIELNGADNITIDGDNPNTSGIHRNLTITNTAAATITYTSAIRIVTGTGNTTADGNTIKNCIINGSATGRNASANTNATNATATQALSFGIFVGGGGAGATTAPAAIAALTTSGASSTVNNLLIDNNAINACARGVEINGASAAAINTVTVSNNLIGATATLSAAPPFTTPTTTVYTRGIAISGAAIANVTGDTIQNIISYTNSLIRAIEITTPAVTTSTIQNNTIIGIGNNSAATALTTTAINVSGVTGTSNVLNNTISNLQTMTANGSAMSASGIEVSSTSTINGNKISKIYDRNTGTYGSSGINIAAGNNCVISNNFISDIKNDMSGGLDFDYRYSAEGIVISGGINHSIYYNTVNLFGLLPGTAVAQVMSSCFTVNSTAQTGLKVENNIFSNTITGGTTPISHTCIVLPIGTVSMNMTLNNNTYYCGANTASQGIADVLDLTNSVFTIYFASNFNAAITTPTTNLRAYTSTLSVGGTNDNASYASTNTAPFISSTDLHILPSSAEVANIANKGVTIGTITTDIDNDIRPASGATNPCIGADEFSVPGNDAGISAYSPFCAGTSTLMATVHNYGLATLTSITVTYSINGGTPVVVPLTVSIVAGGTGIVTLGTFSSVQNTSYSITASTSLPNGAADGNTANDSYTATVMPGLAGTYFIGSGGDYTTLTAALSDYNTSGICGPVVFKLKSNYSSATETFPLVITQPAGASATNTLLICPDAGATSLISGSSATDMITMLGADYVTIDGSNSGGTDRSLTITNTSAGANVGVLYLGSANTTNGATNNTIKNCNILGNGSTTFYGIFTGNAASYLFFSDVNNSNNTIQNNSIAAMQDGIILGGNATSLDQNWLVTGNLIGSTSSANYLGVLGVELINQQNLVMTQNTITGVGPAASFYTTNIIGIDLEQNMSNVTITRNQISNVKQINPSTAEGAWGIYINSTSTASNVNINNNFIYDVATTTLGSTAAAATADGWGIVVNAGGGYNIDFNTIDMITSQSTGISGCINVTNAVTSTNNNLRDNILANNQTSATRYSVYYRSAATVFASMDYNDYFSNGTLAFKSGTTYNTPALMAGAFGSNGNSINVPPVFTSASVLYDLHLTTANPAIIGFGLNIAGITVDIDGSTRVVGTSPAGPTIGAHDEQIIQNDASITGVAQFCPGTSNLTVTVKNFGATALSSVTVTYTVNGGTPVVTGPFTFGTPLASGSSAALTIDTYPFVANTSYIINAVSSLPNGVADGNTNNDSYTSPTLKPGLSGTYFIGSGGDYTSLTAAVSDYNNFGICGPTSFVLKSTYSSTGETFPITINSTNGASSTNKLTISPDAGVTATISGASGSAVIFLNGADYVTVDGSNSGSTDRSLTVTNTSTATISPVEFWIGSANATNGATNNTIKNCVVAGNSSTTTNVGIVSCSSSGILNPSDCPNSNNTIQNNLIYNAQYGAVSISGNAALPDQNWVISNNTMGNSSTSFSYYGLFCQNMSNFTINNNTIKGVSLNVTGFLVVGVAFAGIATNGSFYNNQISGVKNLFAGTASGAYGLNIQQTSTAANLTIYNNFIYDVTSNGSATTTNNGHGVVISAGAGYNIYHNTVSLSTNATAAAAVSSPLYVTAGVTIAGAINLRDNIFSITSTQGNRFSIYSLAAATVFSPMDYDNFWSAGVLAFIGTNRTTLGQLQAGFGNNVHTKNQPPTFVSVTDLHLQSVIANEVFESGTSVGITTDIDGTTRTVPVMGAHEVHIPPTITYTPLAANSCLISGNIALSNVAIFDSSGIPTSGALTPRVYYQKNGGTWFSQPGNLSSGPATNGLWSFIMLGTDVGSLAYGDVVSYYVVAQNNPGLIVGSPSAGFTATDVNTITTPPTTPNTTTVQTPTIFNITPATTGCAGSVVVGLDNSESGVSYQLYNGATPSGSPVAGTGSTISFNGGAPIATGGIYTAIATSALGSCTNGMGGTQVIDQPAAPITGPNLVCIGSNITLADATPNGSWTSGNPTAATIDPVSGIVNGATQGNTIITYSVTNTCGTTSQTASVDVGTVIIAPITGTPELCANTTTLLADATTLGTWGSSDGTKATVDNTGLVTGVAAGSTTISYSITNSCGTNSQTVGVTVDPVPTASVSGTTSICSGSSTTINFSGTPSASVTFSTTGSGNAAIPLNGTGSASLGTGALFTATTYAIISVQAAVTGCSQNISGQSATVSMTTPGVWNGAGTDWSDPANWSCGVPTSSTQAMIPSGTPNNPTIGAGTTVSSDDLYVGTGVILTLGSSTSVLNVSGNVTNLGVVTGGNLMLDGSTTQTIMGTGSITNLELNNTNGVNAATIQAGSNVNLTGTLTLTNGTLSTNGGLILVSDASGTGRIAAITGGDITGAVTAQQYIPGGRRGMRQLSHPFTTSIGLNALTDNIDISGTGGSANGFTATLTNNSSAFWYNTLTGDSNPTNQNLNHDAGWTDFTSTDGVGANAWNPYEVIRILIRGAIGEGLYGLPYTPSPVVYDASGSVNKGTIVMDMRKGAGSDYNMLGNPYPSPVDVGAVVTAAGGGNVAGSMFWVWNINAQAHGGYDALPIATTPSYNIQSNSNFMLRATVDHATLTFNETDKSGLGDVPLLRTTNSNDYVVLSIYDTTTSAWDKLYLHFDDQAAATFENMDAPKPTNSDLDFYSWSTDQKRLNMDARPYVSGQVIPLGIVTTIAQKLSVKVSEYSVPTGAQLYLHDKYLNQYTELHQGTTYNFEITADTATQGDNRFELSLQGNVVTSVPTVQTGEGLQVSVTPNPATDMANVNFSSVAKEQKSIRLVNVSGIEVVKMNLGITDKGTVKLPLEKMPAGIYLVEFTSGNKTITQRLVKE